MRKKLDRKTIFQVSLIAILCLIIGGLLVFEVRLAVGWRPFAEVNSAEDLYYVSYRAWRGNDVNLLDEEKREEFAELLSDIRVRTTGLWIDWEGRRETPTSPFLFDEIYGATEKNALIFEETDQKGKMIELRLLYLYEKVERENPLSDTKRRYGLMINGERYFISKQTYERIEQLIESLEP
ncbi:MAG: hypothetical protein IJZ85_11835 [Lachnospiraceae bacterium]|nr:hypothetical protein [Lachnospiraceae bacterium]